MTKFSAEELLETISLVTQGKARSGYNVHSGYEELIIVPLNPDPEKFYMDIVLKVYPEGSVTVNLGIGCAFDIPGMNSPEILEYLADIMRGCIDGISEEIVVIRNGTVRSSRLKLMLNGRSEVFHYRSSRFLWPSGKKVIFNYSPYPTIGK